MNYIVKMINGDRHVLTREQYHDLQNEGEVFTALGVNILKRSMSNAYPEDMAGEIEDRSKQKTGILHDGTRVIKQFGIWVDANSPTDERGNHTVHLDPVYYPEASRDLVPSPEEFEREYRQLPAQERLEKMLVSSDVKRIVGSGFQVMEQIIGGVEPRV